MGGPRAPPPPRNTMPAEVDHRVGLGRAPPGTCIASRQPQGWQCRMGGKARSPPITQLPPSKGAVVGTVGLGDLSPLPTHPYHPRFSPRCFPPGSHGSTR